MLKLQGFWSCWDECPKKIISDALKNLKTPRQADRGVHVSSKLGPRVSTSNPFDAFNTVEKDDELGTNGGKSKLVEKGAKSDVVSLAHGTSFEAFGSPNTTPLAGGQLEDSDDEIEELDDDTTRYMSFTDRAGGGENDAGLVEDEVFDCYDGYEDQV
ncbi:hypothetical protein Tco_1291927 [Tanacetum coccineum]